MIYAIMFFYHWSEIMDKKPKDDEFILTNTIITENHESALNAYANTRCPASVLLEATSRKELDDKMIQTIKNYKDKEWLETNLYPVL